MVRISSSSSSSSGRGQRWQMHVDNRSMQLFPSHRPSSFDVPVRCVVYSAFGLLPLLTPIGLHIAYVHFTAAIERNVTHSRALCALNFDMTAVDVRCSSLYDSCHHRDH